MPTENIPIKLTRAAVSAPVRTPESNNTASPPPTALATAGSACRAPIAPSTWRPPWLDTITPPTPARAAHTASAAGRIPLSNNGPASAREGTAAASSPGRPGKVAVQDLRLDIDLADVRYQRSSMFRSLVELPITFRPVR